MKKLNYFKMLFKWNLQSWKRLIHTFIIFVSIAFVIFPINSWEGNLQAASTEDTRARIGFSEERLFLPKVNGAEKTLRVFISTPQTTDTVFSLAENTTEGYSHFFQFASNYTLPALASYVDITFNLVQNVQSNNDVLLSEIILNCDTATVVAGDKYYYGESEPYDKKILAVAYDIDGETELIIEGLPARTIENQASSISSRVVRAGDVSVDTSMYYRIRDYNPYDSKELVFQNFNSVLLFSGNEREKNLTINYFDNFRLNLREAYQLDIYRFDGVTKIYDVSQRRYLEQNEILTMPFAIEDDEPLSDKYWARAQYYQPGTTNPTVTMNESGDLSIPVVFSGLNDHPLQSFRLFYTISGGTAKPGYDFIVRGPNYTPSKNLGYIEVDESHISFDQYHASVDIVGINNYEIDGSRTIFLKFFVLDNDEVLLQPLDTITVVILDNEYPPYNNHVSWDFALEKTPVGNGIFNEEQGTLTLDSLGGNYFQIPIFYDYMGLWPLSIPVRIENGDARNGVDYFTDASLFRWGNNRFYLNFSVSNFTFFGTKHLSLTILEDHLTDGLSLTGPATLNVIIEGDVPEGYNYIDYTDEEIEDIFNIGLDDKLSFVLKRYETGAKTTYIDIVNDGMDDFTSEHIEPGTFPYEVNWAQGELTKRIEIPFKSGWKNPVLTTIQLKDHNGNKILTPLKENQRTSVDLSLNLEHSLARYYFSTEGGMEVYYLGFNILWFEYKYTDTKPLRIKVIRDILTSTEATTVMYRLTYDSRGIAPYWIVAADAAEIGKDINDNQGVIEFAAGATEAYIDIDVPYQVGQSGIKLINIELYNPGQGCYILDGFEGNPHGLTHSMAQIKLNNNASPFMNFSNGTTLNTDDQSQILVLEYPGKTSDLFGIKLTFPFGNATTRGYLTDVFLYSEYDLETAGIEVFLNGNKVTAVELSTPYTVFDDHSVYHEYHYRYQIQTYLNVQVHLRYTNLNEENLQDSDILLEAEAGMYANVDFRHFMLLNTASDSSEFSNYSIELPSDELAAVESDESGVSFVVTKDSIDKDCHLYITLLGTAAYQEQYILMVDGVEYELGSDYLLIPKGVESVTIKLCPVDDFVKNGDLIVTLQFHILIAGEPFNITTFDVSIEDDEYFGDFSVQTINNQQVVFSRENYTISNIELSYTINEITGIYGVDYVLKEGELILSNISGKISFVEAEESHTFTICYLTEKGQKAAFELIIDGDEENYTIVKSSIIYANGTIQIEDENYIQEIATNYDMTSYSNYSAYICNYLYYHHFTAGESGIYLGAVKIDYYSEYIFIDYEPDGLSKLYTSVAGDAKKFVVPSGINPCMIDMNNDQMPELVFIVSLDTCFGGMTELNRLNEYGLQQGVYTLDIVTGEYTCILSLASEEASLHHDIYISNLKADQYPEVIVFSTPWYETVQRLGGGNILYIVDNNEGTYNILNVLGGPEGPTAVWITNDQDGHYRPVVNIGYGESIESGRKIIGRVIELSYDRYARFVYFNADYTEVNEGEDITLTLYNATGRAGTFIINISSADAVAYRDYTPESIIVEFNDGEYQKDVVLRTLGNMMPNNTMQLQVRLLSDDFYSDNELTLSIKDKSIMQKGPAYTILGGFDSKFTSSGYVVGDDAIFTIIPLTIDGVHVMESANYDIRFSVRFEQTIWTDDDGDGYISATGLKDIKEGYEDDFIYMTVEFLKKGTSNVFYTKTFEIRYFTLLRDMIIDFECNELYYPGEFINIEASVTNLCKDVSGIYSFSTLGNFKLEFTSNIDNRTYTFYSDEKGLINGQIDYGTIEGYYTYRYKIYSLNDSRYVFESEEQTIYAPGTKMDYAISIIDSVRQSLLPDVQVEIIGLNVNYYYLGSTNSETGVLIIQDIVPLKNYTIIVNGDHGINYFASSEYSFTPEPDQPTYSLELPLREEDLRVDFVSVVVLHRGDPYHPFEWIGSYGPDIVRYLGGEDIELNEEAQQQLHNLYVQIATDEVYRGFNPYYMHHYRIERNVLFDPTSPYKIMNKNYNEVTIIYYRQNENIDFGTVSFYVGGEELTEANSRYNPTVIDEDIYTRQYYYSNPITLTGPHTMYFYSFKGQENCIIDMKVESEMYLKGEKNIQIASFGTGLGNYLLSPITEIFSALETAEIPSNIPYLNNMKFSLGFGAADFAFDFDESEMTFSIYIGASKTIFEKSYGMDYDNVDRPSLQQLYDYRAASLSTGQGKGGLGVGLGGKMMFAYVDGDWKLVHGEIYFSITASYNYTKYIILPVIFVPAFFSATISLEISTTVIFDWDAIEEKTVVTGDLAISLMIEIECGIGIKGFLSASVYGQAGVQVIIQFDTGGAKLTLWVEGGVRIQIIFWKFSYSFGRAEWSTKSHDYIEREGVFKNVRLSDFEAENYYSGVAMLYNENEELTMAFGLDQEGRASTILVQNIYEKSAPQIAEMADGTKMIAWINYDENRGTNNAEVINYIYFDGTNWSDVKVADETLTADLDCALAVVDGRYTIVVTEVKEELSEDAGMAERLKKSDVALLVYDPDNETFTKTILTDNLFNDRQALIDFQDQYGIIVAYRSENANITDDMTANDFLCGPDADNKLYYTVYNPETKSFGTLSLFNYNLKAIASLDVMIVGGVANIVLEMDNDDNFDTVNDRELILIQYIFNTGRSLMTRLTDNNIQDVAPVIQEFEGKVFIAYRSGDELKYWCDGTISTIGILPETYTGFRLYSDGNHALLLYTCPVEGIAQIFASVMDKDTMMFSMPTQVSYSDKPTRDPFISFESESIRLYYCADTYIILSEAGDEEFRFYVESDIMITSFLLSSDLSLEVLPIDYASMVPGGDYIFTIRIYNAGTLNVMNALLMAKMGGNTIASTITDVIQGSGYLDVELLVALPFERATIEFEIIKEDLEEDMSDNTVQAEVLLTEVALDKEYIVAQNEEGTATVTVTVINNGKVDVQDLIVSITEYSKNGQVFDSKLISLTAGESKRVVLTVQRVSIQFNSNNEFWMKVFVLTPEKNIYDVNEDDYDATNNVLGVKLSRVLFEDGSTLAILNDNISMIVGNTTLMAYLYTGDGDLELTTSNPSIVEINGKNLLAKKAGTTTITISDGVVTKSLSVNVTGSVLYTIVFKDSNDTIIMTADLEEGSVVTAPSNMMKTGYSFDGWDHPVVDVMPAENLTYIAQWMLNAPTITAQSGYSGKYDGNDKSISVTATHTLDNVTYQWYKGSITSGNLLAGETNATMLVKDVSDSGTYYCRVSYTDGSQTRFVDSGAIIVSITPVEKKGLFNCNTATLSNCWVLLFGAMYMVFRLKKKHI